MHTHFCQNCEEIYECEQSSLACAEAIAPCPECDCTYLKTYRRVFFVAILVGLLITGLFGFGGFFQMIQEPKSTKNMLRIRIAWKSKDGTASGNGEWQPEAERKSLMSWISSLKGSYPELEHWIEDEK